MTTLKSKINFNVFLASHEEKGQRDKIGREKKETFNALKICACYTSRELTYRPQHLHQGAHDLW